MTNMHKTTKTAFFSVSTEAELWAAAEELSRFGVAVSPTFFPDSQGKTAFVVEMSSLAQKAGAAAGNGTMPFTAADLEWLVAVCADYLAVIVLKRGMEGSDE